MFQHLSGRFPSVGVEDQHAFQEVSEYWNFALWHVLRSPKGLGITIRELFEANGIQFRYTPEVPCQLRLVRINDVE